MTLLDEPCIVACELAPVPEAVDECGVAVLQLDELLKQERQLVNVKEHVDAHLFTFVLVRLVQLHLEVVLYIEPVDLEVVLVENESRNVDEGSEVERLLGQEFKSQHVNIVVCALLPVPTKTPLELVVKADLVFLVRVAANLTVWLDRHDSRHLLIVLLLDKVSLPR